MLLRPIIITAYAVVYLLYAEADASVIVGLSGCLDQCGKTI